MSSTMPPAAASILARELAVIDRADQMIVLDQAPLARETGQHLLIRKRQRPHIKIVVLADPLPEIYGGTPGALSRFARAGRHHRRPHPSRPPARPAALVLRALAHEHRMVERSLRRDRAAGRFARLAAPVELQGGSSADSRCRRRIGRLDWRGSRRGGPGHRGGDRRRRGPRHGGERAEDRRLVDRR